MAFISPLRYPGGKGKIASFIKYVLLTNNVNGTYIEPYAGGAGVACDLLLSELVQRIIINDVDRAVWAFWHTLIHDTENLCTKILNVPVNMDSWHKQKAVQESKQPDLFDLGFSTFFLNRTNVSGILKGGVIGGAKQTGNYLIDARFNKHNLIERIERIAEKRNQIELHNLDTLAMISNITNDLSENTLIYFDPPYFVKGEGLYRNFYNLEDHQTIAERINTLPTHWIVSYDNVPEIKNLYQNYRNLKYDLNYSVNNHYAGKEIIFFSDGLKIPECHSPLEIKKNHVTQLKLKRELAS